MGNSPNSYPHRMIELLNSLYLHILLGSYGHAFVKHMVRNMDYILYQLLKLPICRRQVDLTSACCTTESVGEDDLLVVA